MKRIVSLLLAFFIGFCMLVATDRQAHAYVDPGTGLLALQSVASMAAATGYFMRRKIKALFTRKDLLQENSQQTLEAKKVPARVIAGTPDDSANAA